MKIGKYKYDTSSISDLHHFGVDTESREIWLIPWDDYAQGAIDPIYGDPGVEYIMANRFLRNLHLLMNIGPEPILIHMNTHGGDWYHGMAVYDAIKTCPCYVTIVNYTHARSMSSLILCAADRRVMMPHSVFMFHDGSMGYDGTAKQYLTEAEQLKQTGAQMLDIYVDCMKKHSELWRDKSPTVCRKWLRDRMDKKEEVYLRPQEAIDNGFADAVFDGDWDALGDKP